MDYRNVLDVALKNILVPVNTVTCRDPLCDNAQHSADLNAYADLITDACIETAKASIPPTGWSGRKPVPGWIEHVKPARQHSIFWHIIWIDCGRPKTGLVADIMRRSEEHTSELQSR